MNPLFAREFRARWRDRRAWLLLLTLIMLLALLAYAVYIDGASMPRDDDSMQSALTGRLLFMVLAIGNVLAWLFIAPILSATPIARERERGLLESLQLSPMAPRSQIVARVGASLAFLLILQLTISPIYATIFWLGGVSPGELGLAGLVIAFTAAGGTVLGTLISARARRPLSALFSALGFVVLWILALAPATYGALVPTAGWWTVPANALFWSHPLVLTVLVSNSSDLLSSISPPLGLEFEQVIWLFCAWWSAIGALLMWGATRAVARVMPLRHELPERAPKSPKPSAPLPVDSSSTQSLPQSSAARRGVRGTVALPIARLVRFTNPVLAREVRERLRFGRAGLWATIARFALLILVVGILLWVTYSLLLPDPYGVGWITLEPLIYILWFGGALAIAAMAGASFARERESGTWEALKLSLLGSAEIVRAKWLSPLVALAIWSAPLWILFPLGLKWDGHNGMEARVLLLSLGVIVLSLGTISMVGLLISWRARHPHAALGWILGVGLFVFIALPISREVTDFDRRLSALIFRLPDSPMPGGLASERYARAARFRRVSALWHPVTALNFVQESNIEGFRDGPKSIEASAALWMQLLVFIAVTGGGGWWLNRVVTRDKERADSR